MSFYERLLEETKAERAYFMGRPLIRRALDDGVTADMYIAYLAEAYHHVKFTCPLLGLALANCPIEDRHYREALIEYIDEEKGHEEWILNDIAAFGGDKEKIRAGRPSLPNRVMCGYMHFAIEHVSPYALLGMVHVLEGMSVLLADKAAASIGEALGVEKGGKGFTYLVSHGSLDQDHVAFFEKLVNTIDDAEKQDVIIDTAKVIYTLWGDMFDALDKQFEGKRDAA